MTQRADNGGYSIFRETMADMTYPEIERAARDGAVVLWALGVIEQHGPHLPLGTDIYVPAAILAEARRLLAERGVKTVTVPPFYWGVNLASASFAGSFDVRPEIMRELVVDVLAHLKRDGFSRVFCLSGHGEALHNQTLFAGLCKGSEAAGIAGYVLLPPSSAQRFGYDLADPHLALTETIPSEPSEYLDIHAGSWETSLLWGLYPEVVRSEVVPTLPPTNFGFPDLQEWRQGRELARRKTPDGYFGQPAEADPQRGHAIVAAEAKLVADAICAKLA